LASTVKPDIKKLIYDLAQQGTSHRQIARDLGVDKVTVARWANRGPSKVVPPAFQETKKIGSFSWREAIACAEQMQALKKKASWSQDYADIVLGDGTTPQILMGFGDQHIGAYGCNYSLFRDISDEIRETKNLYIALTGDFNEMAIKMRNVLEVTNQVFTPDMQEAFLEDWVDEMQDKIAFATWENHAIMRQEAQAGTSGVKNILSRRVIYHNGIGHQDLHVGKEVYKSAASHKFRGSSMFNRMHAQGRYVRQEANDRELVLMADIHTWGYMHTEDGGLERCYITGGTLHEGSGYGKRFFSLKAAPHYPCVVLHPDSHEMVAFKSVKLALRYLGQ
jgi:hypothetical protein